MLNQKQKAEMRKSIGEEISSVLEIEGFDFVGFTKEGAAFRNAETGDVFVVRTIMKSQKFDLKDAIQELEERELKAIEKEKEKADKKAKREQKAKDEEGE